MIKRALSVLLVGSTFLLLAACSTDRQTVKETSAMETCSGTGSRLSKSC